MPRPGTTSLDPLRLVRDPDRLAARLLDAPVALVVLLDHDRQFFKSAGLGEPAREGGEALARLAGHTCDVIVSGLRMPGLGGDDLLARLQALGGGLHRRLVFVTGDAASGDTSRIVATSGVPALFKPVDLRHLAQVIEAQADLVASTGTAMSWEDIMQSARILVVDDEQVNVRLMERMLEKAGYSHVFSTTDSRQVLELYRQIRPDLIVLDLHMPDVDGFALMEQIQEEEGPRRYLPILVLTADVQPEAKLRALLVGAKDFLTKPVDRLEALLRIRILLETRFLFLELSRESSPPIAERPGG